MKPLAAAAALLILGGTSVGDDLERLSPSNRRAVVPGAWRIEVSPREAARDDVFLSVLEIGDRGAAPLRIDPVVQAKGLAGAALAEGEATLPDTPTARLLLAGLAPGASYDLQLTSGFAPGAPIWRLTAEANDAGVLETAWNGKNGRLRIRQLENQTEGRK